MDDGYQGDFKPVLVTISTTTSYTMSVQRGLIYRFKFRTANVNGWSDFSNIGYMYAFAQPDSPPPPAFDSGTDSSVTLFLKPSRNDNGIRISEYELFIDQGDDITSEFRKV
jgi:hypothetical protein